MQDVFRCGILCNESYYYARLFCLLSFMWYICSGIINQILTKRNEKDFILFVIVGNNADGKCSVSRRR